MSEGYVLDLENVEAGNWRKLELLKSLRGLESQNYKSGLLRVLDILSSDLHNIHIKITCILWAKSSWNHVDVGGDEDA